MFVRAPWIRRSLVLGAGLSIAAAPPSQAPIKMLPFHQVELQDVVWAPRTKLLKERTWPHAFANTEVARERLRLCAEWLESGGKTERPAPHRYNTSDLYKVLEAGALLLQNGRDEQMEAAMDRAIEVIARAQQDDGYLYVSHITGAITPGNMGARPYSFVVHSHELYNVGHLYEAAIAYAQATGKTRLLEVAEKNAAHVQRVFFEGDPAYNDGEPIRQAPGHQEIELGLIKLYLHTGKRDYLELARRFLEVRGVTYVPDGEGLSSAAFAQQHLPVAQQRHAVGHAVRATYMYSTMAELDSLLGRDDYGAALDAIWHDIVDTKMHLSGGLGAVHGIEGFGPSFVLPNRDAYLETCAAVGNVFFNLRLFLKHGDAKYVDTAELALCNNCLAGVGFDGTSFFYPNPLAADAGHASRSAWFGTACCPSNLARLVPQVAGYTWAQRGDRVYTVLYAASRTKVDVAGREVTLQQRTDYPFDGRVAIEVTPAGDGDEPVAFELAVRIPTWAFEQPVPGALYHFEDEAGAWRLRVNGEPVEAVPQLGYVVLRRRWRSGDTVELELPMPVRTVVCREEVKADRGRVAFTRGPLLLCAEGIDNGGSVHRFHVQRERAAAAAQVSRFEDGVLAGVPRVVVPAFAKDSAGRSRAAPLTMLPYFAWSNRDRSSMVTWLPAEAELAVPDPDDPANAKFAWVSASHTFARDSVLALQRQATPNSSSDKSIQRWTSWPERGRRQWVELRMKQPATITRVGAYFYDDGGGVLVPGTWHIEVPTSDGGWRRVEVREPGGCPVLRDAPSVAHPAPAIATDRLRLVMTPQHQRACVGLLSVDVAIDD